MLPINKNIKICPILFSFFYELAVLFSDYLKY